MTGASGFIGRRALPQLVERGFEVHGVSRRPTGGRNAVAWHVLDLSDHAGVRDLVKRLRPTHLLHLSWETRHGSYFTTGDNLDCLRDALHLVRAFVDSGGLRIVGAGSSAEYEFGAATDFTEDGTPTRPNGLYGACKKALAEVIARFAADAGVGHAWGRIFFCYGPGEHPARLVPTILRGLKTGRIVPFHAGTGIRDYVHVDDVAEAFTALVGSRYDGTINIGSGRPVAARAFVQLLAEAAGHPHGIDFGALPTPDYEPARVVADTTRIAAILGWRPRFSLEDGLRDTVAWWQDQWVRDRTQQDQ